MADRVASLRSSVARLAHGGRALPEPVWRRRHRALVALLALHAIALFALALALGKGLGHSAVEGGLVAGFALVAATGGRRLGATVAALGLLTASAVLVHLANGATEAHFHFFLVVTLLALYEDRAPFLLSVGFVLLHHGIGAATAQAAVFGGHPGAPWGWAGVHAAYIAALSLALTVLWRAAERNRERTEAALVRAERSEQRYRSLVESLAEGVLMLDPAGRIVTANESAERILGATPGSLPGRTVAEAFGPGSLDDGAVLALEQHPAERARLHGDSTTGLAIRVGAPGGRAAWLRTAARPVRDPEARAGARAVVCSFADVTSQRLAAAELAAANAELEVHAAELERSNAELEQFAYIASHDLREPLRMVASYLQLLRRRYRGQLGEDADVFIDYAVEGAGRMRDLIDALLEYSRTGSATAGAAPVETAACVAATLQALAPAIAEAGGSVAVDGELPPVLGDQLALGQLFQNLVANACKFRSPERAPLVRIGAERDGEDWCFSVADNGIGVDGRHRDRIFRMFQRLHAGDEYPGTGIGLAVCRKIVERHGGRIWLEETPGGGATFRFTLPPLHRRFQPSPERAAMAVGA